jgi:hypothetical protein
MGGLKRPAHWRGGRMIGAIDMREKYFINRLREEIVRGKEEWQEKPKERMFMRRLLAEANANKNKM